MTQLDSQSGGIAIHSGGLIDSKCQSDPSAGIVSLNRQFGKWIANSLFSDPPPIAECGMRIGRIFFLPERRFSINQLDSGSKDERKEQKNWRLKFNYIKSWRIHKSSKKKSPKFHKESHRILQIPEKSSKILKNPKESTKISYKSQRILQNLP